MKHSSNLLLASAMLLVLCMLVTQAARGAPIHGEWRCTYPLIDQCNTPQGTVFPTIDSVEQSIRNTALADSVSLTLAKPQLLPNAQGGSRVHLKYTRGGTLDSHSRGRIYSDTGHAHYAMDDGQGGVYPGASVVNNCPVGTGFNKYCDSALDDLGRFVQSINYMQYIQWNGIYYDQRVYGPTLQGTEENLQPIRSGASVSMPGVPGPDGRHGGYIAYASPDYHVRVRFERRRENPPPPGSEAYTVQVHRSEYCEQIVEDGFYRLICSFPMTKIRWMYCNIGFRPAGGYMLDVDPETLHQPDYMASHPCIPVASSPDMAPVPSKAGEKLAEKGGMIVPIVGNQSNAPSDCNEGNPCNPNTGEKKVHERDFDFAGHAFTRTYRSMRKARSHSFIDYNWYHSWSARVLTVQLGGPAGVQSVYVQDGTGEIILYKQVSTGIYRSTTSVGSILQSNPPGLAGVAWRLVDEAGRYQEFDSDGRISAVGSLGDISSRLTFSYLLDIDPLDWAWWALKHVTDARGRQLRFDYDLNATYQPRLLQVVLATDPAQPVQASYEYWGENTTADVHWRLKQVVFPDGGVRRYHYGDHEPALGNNLRYHLTGISLGSVADIDQGGARRFATYAYDTLGRVVDSFRGGASVLADRVQLQYIGNDDGQPTSVAVTRALGDVRTYNFPALGGLLHVNPFHLNSSHTDGNGTVQTTYNANGQGCTGSGPDDWRPCMVIDRRGFVTRYEYSGVFRTWIAEGLLQTTGNPPSSSARSTSLVWNQSLGLLTERRICDGKTACAAGTSWPTLRSMERFVYDSQGRMLAQCSYDAETNPVYDCGSGAAPPVGVRKTSYTYCTAGVPDCPAAAIGFLRGVDGPRLDVVDTVLYGYYGSDHPDCAKGQSQCQYRAGDLKFTENALGQQTQFLAYDSRGRVLRRKDANGTFHDTTYDPRGRLSSITVRARADGLPDASLDAVTLTVYDIYGNASRVIQPNGSGMEYCRDDAQRVTALVRTVSGAASRCANGTPHSGYERIVYSLDSVGNRLSETIYSATNQIVKNSANRYNNRGQRIKSFAAPYADNPDSPGAISTQFSYDENGNMTEALDPLQRLARNEYDALNRINLSILDAVTPSSPNAVAATSSYQHDARDLLKQVIDPKGLSTLYHYNGLGDLRTLESPDTGTTTFVYDAAGNRISETDNRGTVTSRAFDSLNRPVSQQYPQDPTKNISYVYDQVPAGCLADESYGVGRLGRMTDESGETRLCYDRRGNVVRKVQQHGTVQLVFTHKYDRADMLVEMTYPSGMVVSYTRDTQGRVVAIHANVSGSNYPLVSNAVHSAFGPLRTTQFGNGQTLLRARDANFWPMFINGAAFGTYFFSTDDLGNITEINGTEGVQSYAYDRLNRLKQVSGTGGNQIEAFSYDATGNRLNHQFASGSPVVPYQYSANSHRLEQVGALSRDYDANGNTLSGHLGLPGTSLGTWYDVRNRLAQIDHSGLPAVEWRYNARGERVMLCHANVILGTPCTLQAYGEGGELLVTHRPASGGGGGMSMGVGIPALYDEVVWLDNTPVARVWRQGTTLRLHAIHADHLSTPRALSNLVAQGGQPAGTVVWRWGLLASSSPGSNAFGTQPANEDPDGNGTAVQFHLRFPGQQYDPDSGLHYNYFRDYEPQTGRYVESDPIGLDGGISAFAYVDGNPLTRVDPAGLKPQCGDAKCPYEGRYRPCCSTWNEDSWGFTNDAKAAPCKKMVDRSCKYSPAICCDADFHDCTDGMKAGEPDAAAKYPDCQAKYIHCMSGR